MQVKIRLQLLLFCSLLINENSTSVNLIKYNLYFKITFLHLHLLEICTLKVFNMLERHEIIHKNG